MSFNGFKKPSVTACFRNVSFNPLCFILVVAVAAALCLTGLGRRSLWQDEGETVVLARSVLSNGVPKAANTANSLSPMHYDRNYRWVWHPWGQFYLAAAGLAVFGHTEFAARLPFALCGILTVALLYVFVWRNWKSWSTATLAALLLATSVPFVIHVRQCRYYSLSILSYLLVVAVFIELMKRPSRRWCIAWGLALAAQFYVEFGNFVAMLPGLMIAMLAMRARWRHLAAIGSGFALALVLTAPGLILHWDRLTGCAGEKDGFLQQLLMHACYLDGWLIPLLVLVPGAMVFTWRLIRNKGHMTEQGRVALSCLLVMCSSVILMALAASAHRIRYIMPAVSLAKLLLAVILVKSYVLLRTIGLWRPARFIVIAISILILTFTNVASLPMQYIVELKNFKTADFCTKSKPFIRTDLAGLLYELTHDFICPNRIALNIADDLAEPGETVAINYGDLPLMFHRPDLRIVGGVAETATLYKLQSPPDVIIKRPRNDFNFNPYLRRLLRQHGYIAIKFSFPGMFYGNIPDPRWHHFATPSRRLNLTVFLRRDHKERHTRLPRFKEQLEARWYRRR